MSFIKAILMKIARAILGGVMDTIARQLNIVTQQAMEPLEAFVKTVVNGAWTGPDADRFVNEVTNLVKPDLSSTFTGITNFRNGIERALETVERADQQAAQKVSDLANLFGRIF